MGDWNIKGNTEPIRLMLHYAEIEFFDKRYTWGPAPDHLCEEWLSDQQDLGLPSPDLPYWIEGGLKLVEVSVERLCHDESIYRMRAKYHSNPNHCHSQSAAILRYVAKKAKLAGETSEDQAVIDMLAQKAISLRAGLTKICCDKNFENLKEAYLKSLDAKLKFWSNYLGMPLFALIWFANDFNQINSLLIHDSLSHIYFCRRKPLSAR